MIRKVKGKMKQEFYEAITANPIIAAVKDEAGLEKCLKLSEISVVFVLYGEVSSISGIVEKIKNAGKQAVVHMDLVAGLSGKTEAVDFVSVYTKADAIISTRIEQIRRAKELGLGTIYRIFLIDSKVLDKLGNRAVDSADIIEILPGLMPKMIKKLSNELPMPIIAGGLISDKDDVMAALKAGAIAISSTNDAVWEM